MRAFASILLGVFRPAKGLAGAGDAVKWLWIPLAVILLGSVLFKTGVATPMKSEFQRAQMEETLRKDMENWPEADREQYEREMAKAEASGDFTEEQILDTTTSITAVADLVFGVLGAAVAIVYIATYFFVAAKTWANPVKYTTMLTVASLSLLPHAIRNIIQGVYMSSAGVWLQHGGLGALVAPASLTDPPGVAYAILSQIDIFVLWGLAILLGALVSAAVGFEKKRAVSAVGVFVAITGLLQALPILVSAVFMGGMGR
jgi:hypothetical protein